MTLRAGIRGNVISGTTALALYCSAGAVLEGSPEGIAASQAREPLARPCVARDGREPILHPRDEAAQRPDFADFRRRLQDAVARRDEPTIMGVVHPSVRAGFDGSGGPDGFRQQHVDNPDEDFWQEFAWVLARGGSFADGQTFSAPYVFASWPVELDSFECLAVVGTGVRVRARPRSDARILASLSHAVVEIVPADPRTPPREGWQRIRTAEGRVGYISRRFLRSPVDHRAIFQFIEGRWWLAAYIAGD